MGKKSRKPGTSDDSYKDYVEHPRYGRGPRHTGLDVDPCDMENVHLHWINGPFTERLLDLIEAAVGWRPPTYDDGTRVISGTALAADPSKQLKPTVPITHYYDLDKKCRKCGRRFIFFAEEQKYWYEELRLTLCANAVRCTNCRKELQRIQRVRLRYEELFHVTDRSAEEAIEMAECCLFLMEEGEFSTRQCQKVRMLLNGLDDEEKRKSIRKQLQSRLEALEKE